MAKLLRLRRGTTTQHNTFTGAEGEVTVDTTKDTLVVHDGALAGGRPMLREDVSNLGAGAITSTHIADGTIVNADINASAAIASTKLASTGVTAGNYGGSTAVPVLSINAQGQITAASTSVTNSITNGTSNVSVAASGDITVTRAGSTAMTFTGSGPLIPDGQELRFGDGADFRISHTGSDTILSDAGTGDVYLRNDNSVYIQNAAGTETKAEFTSNGAVRLYWDNAQKLETSSTGIGVTGTVSCDGLTCNGTATVAAGTGTLVVKDSDNTGVNSTNVIVGQDSAGTEKWKFGDDQTGSEWLYIRNYSGSNGIAFAVGGTDRTYITGSGHLVPGANNTYDLGDSSTRWRNVYTNDLNLSNEGSQNDVDGTWGSWTIQEGEDDLFLLNRRNGKKYKFNLSEVN